MSPRSARELGSKPASRGSSVVEKVLRATIRELARSGYGALSIEEVATLAGVNKTTVYRRWPTKAELVRAAFESLREERAYRPIAGSSLRTNLIAMGRTMVEFAQTPEGQSIVRMLYAEGAEPELAEIATALRRDHDAIPKALIGEAIRRGELPRGTDPLLLVETLFGAILHRCFVVANEPVDGTYLGCLVDLLLRGAVDGGGRKLGRAK